MNKSKFLLVFLRVSLGWLMFYAGITKILDPEWTSRGYLLGAQTFSGLFSWIANSSLLPVVDALNAWGLTLLGVSLVVGVFVRWSAPLGALLMLLYYFPVLDFPIAGEHSFIIDDHIIYALVLLLLSAINAGSVWGIDAQWRNRKKMSES